MKTNFVKSIAALAVVAMCFGLACVAVSATDKNATVNLEFKDIEVKSAIESLFRNTGKNFAIDQDVSGVIPSLSFKDVGFDQALKNLLKTSGLTYRLDGDIYLISKKPVATTAVAPTDTQPVAEPEPTTAETTIEKIPLSNTGATELLGMMNGNSSSSGGMGGYGGGMGGGMMGGGMSGGMMGGMSGGSRGW